MRRPALRAARGRRRHDPRGDGGHRPPGRRRLRRAPRRHGVADGAGRRQQRPHPGGARHRAAVGPRGVRGRRAGPRPRPRRGPHGLPRPVSRRASHVEAHPLRPRREQARRARAHRRPVLAARLQHRLPRRGRDRVPGRVADDGRRRRRGPPVGAGDQAAQQARRGTQGRRARGRVGGAAAGHAHQGPSRRGDAQPGARDGADVPRQDRRRGDRLPDHRGHGHDRQADGAARGARAVRRQGARAVGHRRDRARATAPSPTARCAAPETAPHGGRLTAYSPRPKHHHHPHHHHKERPTRWPRCSTTTTPTWPSSRAAGSRSSATAARATRTR